MTDYYEIDVLKIESSFSGDAICLRHGNGTSQCTHVVDGGFLETGEQLVNHINEYYESPGNVDHVIVTHPDGDHAAGVAKVLENYRVGVLWMLRPWIYADELVDRFARYTSADGLAKKLKENYPVVATLEQTAMDKGIPILEPFQGAKIGQFTVLAPSKKRFLDLVVESDKTPEAARVASQRSLEKLYKELGVFVKTAVNLLRAAWGEEVFSAEETSAENEMSVVQYAQLCGEAIILTGDAGRAALAEAAEYAPLAGLILPGVSRFQMPHHGSRRNVSTELLDKWLGPRLSGQPVEGSEAFTAAISAAADDDDHPRKAVIRAAIHRGAKVHTNETGTLCMSRNASGRAGWSSATRIPYPESQEE